MWRARFKWILFAASVAAAITLGFFLIPPYSGLRLVRHWGYFVILAAFVGFCGSLFLSLRARREGYSGSVDRAMLVVAGIAALLWQFQEPHGFKVLMDEVVLNTTAMSMHFDREAFVPLKAHEVDGLYVILGGLLDKRPLFFPFLLSLLHDLTGYRPENVFVLNGVLSFILLAGVGHLGRLLSGSRLAGIFGVLLLAGLPLLSLNATSGGFDVLNIVMVLAVVFFGARYLDRPDPAKQNNLVLATVLLAQTRYESALFVGATGLLIVAGWWRHRRPIFSWGLVGAPLFLITLPLQHKVFTVIPGYWQTQGTETPFSPHFFSENVGHAMNFLFTVDDFNTASTLLSSVGIVCTAFAAVYLIRRWRKVLHSAPLLSFAVVALVILANTGLLFCYFWGQFDDYVATRLALPLLTLFCLSATLVLGQWIKSTTGWIVAYVVAATWMWGWAMPTSVSARATHSFLSYQEVCWEREFVANTNESAFFVMHSSLPAIVGRRPAMPIEVLKERAPELAYHIKAGTYDSVYLFQRMIRDSDSGEFRPAEGFDLGPEFLLEPIEQRRLKPLHALRLSRIAGVDLSRALPRPPGWKPRFPPFKIVPDSAENRDAAYVREYLQMLP